ncbi:MAG: oxaloacetate decarboxylase [Kiloniellales bacterium]|nr:oxaloacetate decarboxylase [Kiloniellales bacterium]
MKGGGEPGRNAAELRSCLRSLIARRDALLIPGATDALGARLIEDLGFDAVYITGAGLANSQLGVPDIGLLTLSELVEATTRIADISSLPLLVDIDTGFGNSVNVYRTVRMLERAGASALQIEDQVFPKKCGHFSGKEVIPLDEMLGKLKAALDSRNDPDLQIIARTDARSVEGFDRALERANAFIDEGADIIFVEAPLDVDEIRRIAELPAPQIMNIVIGGKTPMLSLEELKALGFSIVLYANAVLQVTISAVQAMLDRLRREGSLAGYETCLASFEERQRVVGKPFFDALEKRYASD